MIHNSVLFSVNEAKIKELQAANKQARVLRRYPDKERQPRFLKHWTNR